MLKAERDNLFHIRVSAEHTNRDDTLFEQVVVKHPLSFSRSHERKTIRDFPNELIPLFVVTRSDRFNRVPVYSRNKYLKQLFHKLVGLDGLEPPPHANQAWALPVKQ